jgi:site-specific DNA recombinase
VSNRDQIEESNNTRAIRRAAIYTRYSSRMQRPTSTTDQIFQCREAANENGWAVADEHIRSDEECTGQTIFGRNGLAELLQLAKTKPRPFDVIIVDDSSRFGRDQADTLNLWKRLKFCGVELYIVSYRLCSIHPYFSDMFSHITRRDEEASTQHGWRVRRGKKGRFREGYHPGGRCYGYFNEPIEDEARKGVHGRFEVIGCKQRIRAEEAEIVRLIFSEYLTGRSTSQIAKALNAKSVKPPQGARTRCQESWSKEAVYSILQNERYIGKTYWNRSYQVRDPDTGKKEVRLRPEHEVMRSQSEDLRIISDEVFARATEQRERMRRDNRVQALGGMARTPAARQYLLSGLLKCGVCGHNMPVVGSHPVRYGCKMHRQRGTCSNSVTIRLDLLEQALRDGLKGRLTDGNLQPMIVEAVFDEIVRQQKNAKEVQVTLASQTESLRSERRSLDKAVDNLSDAIARMGGSTTLEQKLMMAEARIEQIDGLMAHAEEFVAKPVDREEVRHFVEQEIGNVGKILLSDPVTAKNELRKYISELIMNPFEEGKNRGYIATGDVALFSAPGGVMQEDSMERKPLHYTIAIRLRVHGSQRYTRRIVEENSLPRCA